MFLWYHVYMNNEEIIKNSDNIIVQSLKLKSNRNANIFEAVVGDNVVELFSDVIVKYSIRTGDPIKKNLFNEAVVESKYLICLNKATTYLSTKFKTKKQMKDYLYLKGYDIETINKVLDKLEEYGVINDDYYAEMFIKSNETKLSKKAIENKLTLKGINKKDFTNQLNEIDDSELCFSQANKFMKNKSQTRENKEKLIRHLQYKGYGWDSISHALNKINWEN